MLARLWIVLLCLPLLFPSLSLTQAQLTLQELWVDPINGDDANSGANPDQALQSLSAAWAQIPQGEELSLGYHIHLLPGQFDAESIPNYWESRYGTDSAPIIIQADPGTVTLPNLNLFDIQHLSLIGLTIASEDGMALHCEQCYHVTLRQNVITGQDPDTELVRETVKFNQSGDITLEANDISGANDNAIDFVAVHTAQVRYNRIHNAGDWCMYAKGGSANIEVAYNEFFDCGTGGFTAGQGTGLEFMVAPYWQYEAYNVLFYNNVVHHTFGAGVGVNGGYNVVIAHNTFYHIGERSHIVEVTFGLRSCDGDLERCTEYLAQGAWGVAEEGIEAFIPNRHVYILNNVFYNPPGVESQWQQFFIPDPESPLPNSNLPASIQADDDLVIQGNLIWNGSPEKSLGLLDEGGCPDANPTCNEAQLRAQNAINTLEPTLADPANGDYRLLTVYPAIPMPQALPMEAGILPDDWSPITLSIVIADTYDGQPRREGGPVGAY